MKKNIVFIILLCISLVYATNERRKDPDFTGHCGEGTIWAFYRDSGTLVVAGNGEMKEVCDIEEKYKEEVKHLTFSGSITSIAPEAFSGWNKLEDVECGDACKFYRTGESIFKDCKVLSTVKLSESLVEISDSAFEGCEKLTSVTPLNNLKKIGKKAFKGCRLLASISLFGSGVDTIPESAFDGCSLLNSITLPNGLQTIGPYAFRGCRMLGSITIPSSVTTIAEYAFKGCSILNTISSLDSVTTFGASAFMDCSKLASVRFNKAEVIPESLFEHCTSLETVVFPGNLITIEQKAFSGCSSLVIDGFPSTLKTIGDYAFNGSSSITSLHLHSGLDSLGEGVFRGCSGLVSVDFSYNPVTIPAYAFEGCSSLKTISSLVDDINIDKGAFKQCTSLEVFLLPAKLQIISESVFEGCSSLTGAYMPQEVDTIEKNAFKGCSSLVEVTFTNKITNIPESAFEGCTSLSMVTLPESLVTLSSGAFKDCTGLTSVLFPSDLHEISSSVFEGCTSLTEVFIPKITTIGDHAFSGCSQLTHVSDSFALTDIGSNAFRDCVKLTSITFPESLASIGTESFYNCSSLTSITIPQKISVIPTSAFQYCTGLTSVSFTDGQLETLSQSAFANCSKIRFMNLPTSVRTIKNSAFYNCKSLLTIDIPDEVTHLGPYAFSGCSSLGSIHIPNQIGNIPKYAFDSCIKLDSVDIPDGITSIDEGAFRNCASLTSISIPSSVDDIRFRAFSKCDKLAKITVPSTNEKYASDEGILYSKGYSSLVSYPCGKGDEFTIPTEIGVSGIGQYAFSECSFLTSLFIPEGVTVTSNSIFSCPQLSTVHYLGKNDPCYGLTDAFVESPVTGINTRHSSEVTTICGKPVIKAWNDILIDGSQWCVRTGTKVVDRFVYGDYDSLFSKLMDYHGVDLTTGSDIAVDSLIDNDYILTLCHKIVCDGVVGEDEYWFVKAGSSISEGIVVGDDSLIKDIYGNYAVVDSESRELFADTTKVTGDMVLVACKKLVFPQIDDGIWYIKYNSVIKDGVVFGRDLIELDDLVRSNHVISSDGTGFVEISVFSKIDSDYTLYLCYEIVCDGIVGDSHWFVKAEGTISESIVAGDPSLIKSLYQSYTIIDFASGERFADTTKVTGDMELVACNLLDFPQTAEGWYIKNGSMIKDGSIFGQSDKDKLFSFFKEFHAIDITEIPGHEITVDTVVSSNQKLILSYMITVDGVVGDNTWFVEKGKTIKDGLVAGNQKDFEMAYNDYIMIDPKATEKFEIDKPLECDLNLALCNEISFGYFSTESWLIINGTCVKDGVFGDEKLLDKFLEKYHAMIKENEAVVEFTSSSVVTSNLVLTPCFEIKCTMIDKGLWYIQESDPIIDGVFIGDKELLAETFEKYHVVDKATQKVEFHSEDKLNNDIDVVLARIVNVNGAINGTFFVIDGSEMGIGIPALSPYFNSNDYIVGFQDSNGVIDKSMKVNEDLNIVVMKRDNGVVIEFEESISTDDIQNITSVISELLGVNASDIIVDVQTDEQGMVISVIVYVSDSETAAVLVDTVNELDKGESCTGALCQTKRVYIKVDSESIESAMHLYPMNFVTSFVVVISMFLLQRI